MRKPAESAIFFEIPQIYAHFFDLIHAVIAVDARERILYMNYNRVKADVDQLIVEVQQEFKK